MWKLLTICCLSFLLPKVVLGQDLPLHLAQFDKKGDWINRVEWASKLDKLKTDAPKHIFLFAHGWRNNSRTSARAFDALVSNLKGQQGTETAVVIGIEWPSLMTDDGTPTSDILQQLQAKLVSRLAEGDLAAKKEKIKPLLRGFRTLLSFAHDMDLKGLDTDKLVDSIDDPEQFKKMMEAFSYYHMKKRGGKVGRNGLNELLTALQVNCRTSRLHIIGHSFGCKVCLECLLSRNTGSAPVHSLTLLQGAVSHLCFAPDLKSIPDLRDENLGAGAYSKAGDWVTGTICLTRSDKDTALGWAYRSASFAGGHLAELPDNNHSVHIGLYRAIGRDGYAGVTPKSDMTMKEQSEDYTLSKGIHEVECTRFIKEHGKVHVPEVARLVWAAARFTPP